MYLVQWWWLNTMFESWWNYNYTMHYHLRLLTVIFKLYFLVTYKILGSLILLVVFSPMMMLNTMFESWWNYNYTMHYHLTAYKKRDILWEHVRLPAGEVKGICPLCNLNFFQWIIIKLSDVCWHNLFPHSITSQISWSAVMALI